MNLNDFEQQLIHEYTIKGMDELLLDDEELDSHARVYATKCKEALQKQEPESLADAGEFLTVSYKIQYGHYRWVKTLEYHLQWFVKNALPEFQDNQKVRVVSMTHDLTRHLYKDAMINFQMLCYWFYIKTRI